MTLHIFRVQIGSSQNVDMITFNTYVGQKSLCILLSFDSRISLFQISSLSLTRVFVLSWLFYVLLLGWTVVVDAVVETKGHVAQDGLEIA